jgi:UDP-N-acetylmuramoyl-tripeptide--D-alanyl-D-alanine ligase
VSVRARGPIVLTGADVAAVTGGHLFAGAADAVGRVSIDSRTIARGDFFVALRGPRFDGAAFARAALAAGAAGVMVTSGAGLGAALSGAFPVGAVVIEVRDTLEALQALAQHVRRASGARVTAITGSAGKTTTKEIAAEFLATRYVVYRNPGNLNNQVGLPLSLLDLRSGPEMAVVELGMNHPAEIRRLVALAEPDVRVWTNVGDAHLGHFESAEGIADAKAEIFEGAAPASLLVANGDDARIAARLGRFVGRVVTFGFGERCQVRAVDVEDLGIDGTRARLLTPAGEAGVAVPLVGRGNLMNVLAAAAVALEFDVPVSEVAARVASLRPAAHRGTVVRLRNGITLVDDSYNSSPSALRQSLEAVAGDTRHRRRVAVLGEMLELGSFSETLHRESGAAVGGSRVDALVVVGGTPAAELAAAARGAGVEHVRHVASSHEATRVLDDLLRAGDLVLVKGSRGIGLDTVVAHLAEAWG